MRLPSDNPGFAGPFRGPTGARRRLLGILLAAVLFAAVLVSAFLLQSSALLSSGSNLPARELFSDPATVWTVRLHLEPDDWEAMEPRAGADPFAVASGSGRPGPGPPPLPPRPGDFGPGTFVSPIFMADGDTNHDQRLALQEIRDLADRWFTQCDPDNSGRLDASQLREGLNRALTPKGPPPAFGGGPSPFGGGPPGAMFLAADGKRNGIAGVLGIDFPWVRADLELGAQQFSSAAVRWKGNGTFLQSRGSLKRSLKVKLGKGAAGRLPGGVGTLNLHSNVTDPSWMNEVLSYRMFSDAGVPAPRTGYARLYLTVPGKHEQTYVGLYSLVENLDNDFAVRCFGTKKGALFKPVARRLFEDLGDDWNAYRQAYDPKTPLSDEETRHLIAFCKLLTHASDEQFAAQLDDFLDLDEFARFMAVTVWLSTLDSILAMDQNFVVYLHPKTRCFQFIPWDLDHSFGQFYPMGTPEQRQNLSIHKPWTGEFPFLERVFAVPGFKRLYLAHLTCVNETLGRPERLHHQVDKLARLLRPAVADESEEKLARFDKVVAGEPVGPVFGGGSGGPPPGLPPVPSGQNAPQNSWPTPGPAIGSPIRPPTGKSSDSAMVPPTGPIAVPPNRAPSGPPLPGIFGAPILPIKGFATARYQSVRGQLDGTRQGAEISGMGPPGRPGLSAGPKSSDPAQETVPFGPGMFWAPLLMDQFDANEDERLTRKELAEGFQQWFRRWDSQHSGSLSEDQLRAGLNKTLGPPGGFLAPPSPGFGPPPPGSGPPGPGFGPPGPGLGPFPPGPGDPGPGQAGPPIPESPGVNSTRTPAGHTDGAGRSRHFEGVCAAEVSRNRPLANLIFSPAEGLDGNGKT